MYSKLLDSIESSTFSGMFAFGAKTTGAILIAASLFDTQTAVETAKHVFVFADYAIPKTALSFAVIFGWRYEARFARWMIAPIMDRFQGEEDEDEEDDGIAQIRGIPVSEIVDHLFSEKSFKIKDVQEKLAISRGNYDFLSKGLEECGILVRGENNSKIIDKEFSREQVVSILANVDRGGFPSKKEVRESRVEKEKKKESAPLPQKDTGFILTKIEEIAI